MHPIKRISVLTAMLAFIPLAWGDVATNESSLRLTIDLVDGSRIIGVPNITVIPVQTAYAKLDMGLKYVRSITMEKDRELAVFEMQNGDRVKGALIIKTLELKTAFGNVEIGAEQIATIGVISGNLPRTDLRQGLVLYYSFDKDESGYITDMSGMKNNGILHGTEWLSRGKVGGARSFNGKSDYISIDYNEKSGLFQKDAPLSVAVWFKTSASVPLQQMLVATHYAGTGRDGYHLCVDMRNYGGNLYWVASVEGAAVALSQSAVNDGRWHHAVGVWDGRENKLFIDGILQQTVKASGSLVYEHKAPFHIGHAPNNGASHARDELYYFYGAIDEVMVFNRSLSAEDVHSLYDASK